MTTSVGLRFLRPVPWPAAPVDRPSIQSTACSPSATGCSASPSTARWSRPDSDPYLGYLHGIRSGKPALALDLMEEFPPLLVDRLVLTLVNREQLNRTHTETLPGGAVQLTDDGRRFFLE